MNASQLLDFTNALQLNDSAVIWCVNVLIQVTLVATLALATSACFRRSSAIRYGILCCGLGLSLLCPLSVLCLQTCGVGLIAVSLQSERASSITNLLTDNHGSLPAETYAGSVNTHDVSSPYKPIQKLAESWPQEIDVLVSQGNSLHVGDHAEFGTAMESIETDNAELQLSQLLPVPPRLEGTSSSENRWTQIARVSVQPLIVLWLAVAITLLLRLAVGWSRVAAILRDARPIDDSRVRLAYQRACEALSVPDSLAELRISRRIAGPLAAGWRCPQIVLPETLTERISFEQLHEILVHEVAHVVRRDQIIVLLQNITNAIYWFHPLARRLNRSLAQAREEVCDNYVLNASDAPTYSRTLLTVAEMTRCKRPLPGTVGLFTSRWKLESRVAGLLDVRRSRMTKLTRPGMFLVASMSLLVLALVSAGTMTLAVADGPEPTRKTIKADEELGTKESSETTIENTRLPSFLTEPHVINGRVLDAGGSPVANAKVVVGIADLERRGLEQAFPVTVVSGPNGDYTLSYRLGQFVSSERTISWEAWAQLKRQLRMVAKAEGYGPAWQTVDNIDADEAIMITLPRAVSLSGRLVNIEGAPAAGARIKLDSLERAGMHLDPWLATLKQGEEIGQASQKHGLLSLSAYLLGGEQEYLTDAEGQFTISNIGEDQLVKLIVQGDGLAWQVLRMIARDMPSASTNVNENHLEGTRLYGASSEAIVVAPSRPIVGVVRDFETHQPVAGVSIESADFAGSRIIGSRSYTLRSETDTQGRFRLEGMPIGRGNVILAVPTDDQPYFMRELNVPPQEGLGPIEVEIELGRGVWIEGKVVDRASGEPIISGLKYLPFLSNEVAGQMPGISSMSGGFMDACFRHQERYQTKADGTFRIVGVPGRAIVGAETYRGSNEHGYRKGVGLEKIAGIQDDGSFATYRNPFAASANFLNVLAEINVPASGQVPFVLLEAERGVPLKIAVTDSQGRPVTGFQVSGKSKSSQWSTPEAESEFTASGLAANEERTLFVMHEERGIGKAFRITPDLDRSQIYNLRLEPFAVARGRLHDATGLPIANARVTALSQPTENYNPRLREITTDQEGRFEISQVPAGIRYRLEVWTRSPSPRQFQGVEFEANSGKVIDFGVLTAKEDGTLLSGKALAAGSSAAFTNPAVEAVSSVAFDSERSFVYSGQVLTPDGEPAKGAKVRLVYWFSDQSQAVRDEPDAIADDQGHFQFAIRPGDFYRTSDSAPPWHWASLAVTAEGYGLAWASSLAFEETGQAIAALSEKSDPSAAARLEQIRADIAAQKRTVRLGRETLIHGKVINTEGDPVPNIRVRLIEAFTGDDDSLDTWLAQTQQSRANFYASREALPKHLYGQIAQVLIANATTDGRGSYTIRGLGAEQLVRMVLQSPKTVTEATYSITRNVEPFELNADLGQPTKFHATHPVHVAVASRPIQGVVLHESTGEPLEGVLVNSRPSIVSTPAASTKTGSEFDRTMTDARGRFTLTGLPNVSENSLYLTAPMTSGVLPRLLSVDTSARGLEPHVLEVKLVPGTVLSGKVTDAETGSGVAGYVQYLSASDLPTNGGLTLLPMAPSTVNTERADRDGNFQIAIPGGPGYLAFRAFDEAYEKRFTRPDKSTLMISGLVESSLANGRPEFHALEKLDIGPDSQPVDLQMKVHRGKIYSGKFTTADGKVVESGFYYGFDSNPGSWRPFSKGLFSFVNYKSTESRQISVVSEDLKWSATYTIHGKIIEPPTIELQPAAMVAGRIVDNQGNPLSNLQISQGLIRSFSSPRPTSEKATKVYVPLLRNPNGILEQITDEDGRFTIQGLVAGSSYDLSAISAEKVGNLVQDLTLEPGESRDLGTLELLNP